MPVAAGVGQALHDQNAHALGPCGAVGRVGERLAPAVRRQPALPAESDEAHRRRYRRHPSGQRQRALPHTQRLGRQVQ